MHQIMQVISSYDDQITHIPEKTVEIIIHRTKKNKPKKNSPQPPINRDL